MCMLKHPNTYWTIIWSALGLEGSAPRGYSCFTAGQVTLPPPFHRPSPREQLLVKATHTGTLPTAPCPAAGTRLNTKYLSPNPTHRAHLNDRPLAKKCSSLWLLKWNLLTGNERKCYSSSRKQWFGTEQNVSTAVYQKLSKAGFLKLYSDCIYKRHSGAAARQHLVFEKFGFFS